MNTSTDKTTVSINAKQQRRLLVLVISYLIAITVIASFIAAFIVGFLEIVHPKSFWLVLLTVLASLAAAFFSLKIISSHLRKKNAARHIREMSSNMDKYIKMLDEDSTMQLRAVDHIENKYGHHEIPFKQTTISVFLFFSIKDIFGLYKIFFSAQDPVEKNLMARTLATHLNEFIVDTGEIIGRPLENLYKGLPDPGDLPLLHKNLKICFQSIREHYMTLHKIRNFVSAHKDRNVRLQLDTISNMDNDEFDLIIAKLQFFLLAFFRFRKALSNSIQAVKKSA